MNPFPLPLIASKSERLGLAFLLIGGHAVNHYAAPRGTLDIDLLVRTTDREPWIQLVTAEGFRLLHDGGNFLQFSPPHGTAWRLDFMLVNDTTFGKLRAQAVPAQALDLNFQVPSAVHLVALKLHAMAHGPLERRDKDLPDVVNIMRAQHLSLDDEPLREIMARYGTPELVRELRKRLP